MNDKIHKNRGYLNKIFPKFSEKMSLLLVAALYLTYKKQFKNYLYEKSTVIISGLGLFFPICPKELSFQR